MKRVISVTRPGRLIAAVPLALALTTLLPARTAQAAVVGVPATTTVPVGGTTSVPLSLSTGGGESFTMTGFTINIIFDPTLFTLDASSIALNPILASAGFTGGASVLDIGGGLKELRVTQSSGTGFFLSSSSNLSLFDFNLSALGSTPPGTYSNALSFAPINATASGTNVIDDADTNRVTQTSPGSVNVSAIPEPSQVAMLLFLGVLGGGKAAWSLARRKPVQV